MRELLYSCDMHKYFPKVINVRALLLALACVQTEAAPAHWWQWRSVVDSTVLACSQTPLGPGWEKFRGPFKDSHCEKLILIIQP